MILKFMKQQVYKDNENVLDLNPFKSLINLQFSNLEFQSNDIATNVRIHSCDKLLINEVQIKDLQTKYRYTFENIKSVIICNLSLKNLNIQSIHEFFSFKNINSIEIRNITLNNCKLEQNFMYFYNVSSIKIFNTVIEQSLFRKEVISVEKVENFSLENIQLSQKQLDSEQIKLKEGFTYVLKFKSVSNVSISKSTLSDLYQMGFLSFEGNMINFEKTDTLSIDHSEFTNIKISQPFIILKLAKKFQSNILNAKNIKSLKSTDFINLYSISEVDLIDFNIKQFNINQQLNRNLESQSLNNQLYSYLLSLQGISKSSLENVQFIQCNQIGILSIISSDEYEGNIQISKQLDILNLKLENSEIDILDQPLFKLQIKQANLIKFNITDIKSQHHIIDTNSFQTFTISESIFKSILFKNSSATFIAQNSGTLILNQNKFENIVSYKSSPSLIINDIEILIINLSKFLNLKNKQLFDDKSQRKNYDGNINIQQCKSYLKITDSEFKNNESYLNGGVFYLNTINNVTITNSNFENNFAQTQSGGAIFLVESKVYVISSFFIENKSIQEKGGAFYSINKSFIKLKNTKIMNNEAIIGGGIYHDLTSQLDINETNTISENKGFFYGKNKGSYPKSIKRFDTYTNQTYELIEVFSFQSGNFTKQDFYISFYDEEDNILNFLFNDDGKMKVSERIQEEYKLYEIELKNTDSSQLFISKGQQLKRDEEFRNYFKLNITASFNNKKDFELKLFSTFQNIEIKPLKLKLNFRDCIFGEIATHKSGFVECNECPTNTYSLQDPYDSSSLCQKCPTEAEYCQASTIQLKDGFWRESKLVDKIYSCPLKGCSEKRGNDNRCIDGYIGPACSSCDYNEYENQLKYGIQGTDCFKCSDLEFVYLFLAATLIFYIGYILKSINSQIQFKENIIKLYYLRKIEMLYLSKTKQNGADNSVLTKILLHYIQIFSVSMDFYNNLPFGVHTTINVIGDPTKVTYNSYDCMYNNSKIPQLWMNRYLTLWGQIIIISCIILLIQRYLNKKNKKQNRIKIYAIFLYLFYYPSHTKLLIQLCICKEYGSKSYLLNDLLQECWTTEHLIFSAIFIYPFTLIWVVGIPLLMVKKIKDAMKQNKTQTIEYILSYYLIQQGYKDKFYYWEVVKMLQKFAIMASLSSSYGNQMQKLMIILICFFYLQSLQYVKPFSSSPLMKLELLLTQIIMFSLILQVMLDLKDLPNSLNIILVVVILLANAFGILMSMKQYFFLSMKQLLKKLSDSKFKQMLLKIKYFKEIDSRQKVSLARVSKFWKMLKNATLSKNLRHKIYTQVYIPSIQNQEKQLIPSEIYDKNEKTNEQNKIIHLDTEQVQLMQFTQEFSPNLSNGTYPFIPIDEIKFQNKDQIPK